MQLVPYRMLRNEPGEVRRLLEQEGELIVTSNNRPIAVMLGVEEEALEETLLLIGRVRAQKALSDIRRKARADGLDSMTAEEIDAEIAASRSARKARAPR